MNNYSKNIKIKNWKVYKKKVIRLIFKIYKFINKYNKTMSKYKMIILLMIRRFYKKKSLYKIYN